MDKQQPFATRMLPAERTVVAPDGSDVRVLLALGRGGMAHFELGPNQVSRAVVHKTVEEIWYFLSGRGQMWRKAGEVDEVVDVHADVSITIPIGTCFQLRNTGHESLSAVGVTMPPWPGPDEAYLTTGKWEATD